MAWSKPKIGQTKLLVVAIDLGTTYSGYAFSFRDKPRRISTNPAWIAGSDRLMSLKTPTCVLLNPDKEFDSFGYEAENKFSELAEEQQHHGWYFFRRFKMLLYDTKGITAETTIEDFAGQTMPALTIFEHSIRYLKDRCLNSLKNQYTKIDETDIQYVLTVPAIWDDKAKIFMRKAAIQAGIPSEQLRMALEPEAASLWCQVESEKEYIDIGRKYMVVDLGGGTADITVNEKNDDGTLKELHKATGGSWGGTEVDKNFESFLCQIYGEDVVEELKDKDMGDYFNILRSFETKKRIMKFGGGQKVVILFPAALRDIVSSKGRDINKSNATSRVANRYEANGNTLNVETSIVREWLNWLVYLLTNRVTGLFARSDTKAQDVKGNIVSSCLANRFEVKGDKLKVESSIVEEWCVGPLHAVTDHIKGIFALSDTDVESILLVGGFAESPFVQESLRNAFQEKKVVVPKYDAGLAVLKGAVRFGHFPELIAARKSKYNYGVGTMTPFDPAKHGEKRRHECFGEVFCKNIFEKVVAINESLPYGHHFTCNLSPSSKEHTDIRVTLYVSETANTYFCDDEGCRRIGEIIVHVPASESQSERDIKVYISFWDTEIKFQVEICKTGHRYEEMFDHF